MPYSELLELSPDAILVNCGGKIVYANRAAARLLNVGKPEDLIGLSPLEFIHPHFHSLVNRRIARTLRSGHEDGIVEQIWKRRDGVEITVAVAVARVHWHGQWAIEVSLRDVSAQRRIRDELQAARTAAEQAAMSRSRLISAVSHDLRQPLQSLSLFASVVRADPNVGPQSRIALDHMLTTIDHMGGLLGEILNVAKIDLGLVGSKKQAFGLMPLLEGIVTEMAPLAEAKGLVLKSVATSLTVESDPALLTTMIRNLIANAIRYTDSGKVLVGARRSGHECLIEIHDSGIGIDAEKISMIFEEFYQIDNDSRDSSLGLGLGLSIVRRLTSVLGHRILVRSVRGKGSAFCIIVPMAA